MSTPEEPTRLPGRRRKLPEDVAASDGRPGGETVVGGPESQPEAAHAAGARTAGASAAGGRRAAREPEQEVPAPPAPEGTTILLDEDTPSMDRAARRRRPRNGAPQEPGARRRRLVGRRWDPVLALCVVVPLVVVGALATVHPAPTQESLRAPGAAPLQRSVLVCPAGLPGSEQVSVALADASTSGRVGVAGGEPFELRAGRVGTRSTSGTVVLDGNGATAVGLLAVRGDAGQGTICQGPRTDVWFTGVGGGPEHTSRLRLVNPDSGPAVADVEVLTSDGPQEVRKLRGLTVEAKSETVIDLDSVVPDRDDMSLRVTVPRGRLALSVTDTLQEIGSDVRARSWLAGQSAGTRTTHLLGVERGTGRRTLVLANAGEDEARVSIRFVTEQSEFVPAGLETVTVPPGSTSTVNLSKVLASKEADGLHGLRLDSEVPVTATLRTVRGKRLQHTVGAPWLRKQAATVLPDGGSELVVAGAERMTDVIVRQRTADGTELEPRTVPVPPNTAVPVELSSKARVVVLEVGGQPVRAAVVASKGDPAQVRVLEELPVSTAVPDVRPALK